MIYGSPREARDFKNYTEKKLICPGPTRPDRRRTVVKVPFFLIFFRIFLVTSRGVIGRTVYSRPRIFITISTILAEFLKNVFSASINKPTPGFAKEIRFHISEDFLFRPPNVRVTRHDSPVYFFVGAQLQ